MYKTSILKILSNKKVILQSFIFSISILILIFLGNSYKQVFQIFVLDLNLFTKLKIVYNIIIDNFNVLPVFTRYLYFVWIIVFCIFNLVFIYLWNSKTKPIKNNSNNSSGVLALISSTFSYFGFGCIACGHTILLSFFTLFFTITTSFLHNFVNVILIIGISLLTYSIQKDLKLIYLDKSCPI